jgi:very-short-patch-repair endonuclease
LKGVGGFFQGKSLRWYEKLKFIYNEFMSPFQPVFHDYNKNLIERARANRKEMTPAERRMWFDILKNLPYRFLKQRVIGNYIADFYCAAHQLVIEVDGDSHFNEEAIAYDLERTAYFFSLGIRVIRFTNNEVLQNSDGVFQEIKQILQSE